MYGLCALFLVLLAIVGLNVYEKHLARRRRPGRGNLTPDQVRQRLTRVGFAPLRPRRPYDRQAVVPDLVLEDGTAVYHKTREDLWADEFRPFAREEER